MNLSLDRTSNSIQPFRSANGKAVVYAALRLFALLLAAGALAWAGQAALSGLKGPLAVGPAPMYAMALPAGLAIAVLWRWGVLALVAVMAGQIVATALLGQHPADVVVAAVVVGSGAWVARVLLRRLRFDARLLRAADTGALVAASVVSSVLSAAMLAAAASVASSAVPSAAAPVAPSFPGTGMGFWPALFAVGCVLVLGCLVSAVAALSFDRSLLLPQQRRLTRALSAAALVSMFVLLALSDSSAGIAGLAACAALLIVVALALREQIALASIGLLVAGLQMGAVLSHSPSIGGGLWSSAAGNSQALLALWTATTSVLMLGAHAAVVEWRGRSQRWEWALDGSRLGVADWHLQHSESFASAAWRTLTSYNLRGWSFDAWLSQVHADDRPALDDAIRTLTAGDTGRREVEIRMPQDGGHRWAEATLMVIERDSSGRPLRLLATLADIHDKREALERQRMSASLFQHLHEGLLITDPDLRALDVNPAYTQILGVPREEVLGTVPSLLRPTPADPLARQQRAAMWASLRDLGSWRGELMERRPDGDIRNLQTTISTVRGPADDLRYHVLVISDITEQRAQRDQLQRQAHFDELTRLPNRTRLSQLLDDAMQAADRDGYLLVVCYLDLDRFKPVNDRYGHAAGDRLLAELAGRLRGALRSREQWTDSAARLGGDEFVLLLRAGTLEEGRMAVERVLRVVAQPYPIGAPDEPVTITASMGATVYPIDRSDADTLLRHADHAMYGAKQSGRNGYLFFDPEQRRRTEERVLAISRIQEALDLQEFVLYYQPKVDMRQGRVIGFEALLRWEHPQQGLVAPLQFLPLIENTGLSSRVGDWVISRALEHLSNWKRSGLDFSVSVNVSARHLQEPDFALRLSELLARHPEPLAARLEIEMLETAAHADIEATSALLARCQGTGVRFALDDFGTGYSTLNYLKRLPVDVLKIDRSFVHHMLEDPQDRAIVEGVIGLARTFGCTVVAEGVESPAQARTLLELGCDIGQGTGIAAPMPAAEVAGWVRAYKGMFTLVTADGLEPPVLSAAGPK